MLDRPRNVPTRTGLGVMALVTWLILLAAGANDVIAVAFHLSINTITWVFRVLIFVVPPLAYVVTKRICLGLQRRDRDLVLHGRETGRIVRLPNGEMIEVHEPISDARKWELTQHLVRQPAEIGPAHRRQRRPAPQDPGGQGARQGVEVLLRGPGRAADARRGARAREQRAPLSQSHPSDGSARLCLVTGASGYIGGRLVPELLAAGYRVRVMARQPQSLRDRPWAGDVEMVRADASDAESLVAALDGVDVAYYLIHALGTRGFERTDRENARRFGDAARAASVGRLVYLGGLAPRGRGALRAPALPAGGRRDPAGVRRAHRGAARRGHHRVRLGVLRDAALPHRAAAGDDHAALGRHPHPAHRDPRRAALPGRRGGAPRARCPGPSTSAGPTSSPTAR